MPGGAAALIWRQLSGHSQTSRGRRFSPSWSTLVPQAFDVSADLDVASELPDDNISPLAYVLIVFIYALKYISTGPRMIILKRVS